MVIGTKNQDFYLPRSMKYCREQFLLKQKKMQKNDLTNVFKIEKQKKKRKKFYCSYVEKKKSGPPTRVMNKSPIVSSIVSLTGVNISHFNTFKSLSPEPKPILRKYLFTPNVRENVSPFTSHSNKNKSECFSPDQHFEPVEGTSLFKANHKMEFHRKMANKLEREIRALDISV